MSKPKIYCQKCYKLKKGILPVSIGRIGNRDIIRCSGCDRFISSTGNIKSFAAYYDYKVVDKKPVEEKKVRPKIAPVKEVAGEPAKAKEEVKKTPLFRKVSKKVSKRKS